MFFTRICKYSRGESLELFMKTLKELIHITEEMNEAKCYYDETKLGLELFSRHPEDLKLHEHEKDNDHKIRVYHMSKVKGHLIGKTKHFTLFLTRSAIILEKKKKTTISTKRRKGVLVLTINDHFRYQRCESSCIYPNCIILWSMNFSPVLQFKNKETLDIFCDALEQFLQQDNNEESECVYSSPQSWKECILCRTEFQKDEKKLQCPRCGSGRIYLE